MTHSLRHALLLDTSLISPLALMYSQRLYLLLIPPGISSNDYAIKAEEQLVNAEEELKQAKSISLQVLQPGALHILKFP